MKFFRILSFNFQIFQNQVEFFLSCRFFYILISCLVSSNFKIRYYQIETLCIFNLYYCSDAFTEKISEFVCLIIMRNKLLWSNKNIELIAFLFKSTEIVFESMYFVLITCMKLEKSSLINVWLSFNIMSVLFILTLLFFFLYLKISLHVSLSAFFIEESFFCFDAFL